MGELEDTMSVMLDWDRDARREVGCIAEALSRPQTTSAAAEVALEALGRLESQIEDARTRAMEILGVRRAVDELDLTFPAATAALQSMPDEILVALADKLVTDELERLGRIADATRRAG